MKLYLIRHSAADEAGASLNDFDRALTMKGRKRTREVAKALLARREAPSLIVSSPLVRAVQTAEIMASLIEPELAVAIRQELGPGGNVFRFVRELVSQGHESVMLVGHEPTCSDVVGEILADGEVHRPLQNSMVVALKVEASGQGKLRFVLDPRTLDFHSHEYSRTREKA